MAWRTAERSHGRNTAVQRATALATGSGVPGGTTPVPLQMSNAVGAIAPNTPATYRFAARYFNLGGTPSPGPVRSAMIFTLDYQ